MSLNQIVTYDTDADLSYKGKPVPFLDLIDEDGVSQGTKELPRPIFKARKGHESPGEDDFVLIDFRKARRIQRANRHREMARGQKKFIKREWAKEREANQLAQLFNLKKGLVPGSRRMRLRADAAIYDRVRKVVALDQDRYSQEITARQRDRSLPAPRPPVRHQEVLAKLEEVALSAPTKTPKVAR